IIENLWYPQDEINKRHSSIVHILTTIGANQILFTDEFLGDTEEKDMNANLAKTGMNIKVGKLTGKDNKPTFFERKPADVPAIFERIIGNEKEDVKYIPGATDPMAGKSERRESGVAKKTDLQRASQRLSVYIDNFKHTKIMEGKSYIWWIQNKYTEEKLIRIYGDNLGETDQEITVNKHALGKIFNDVTIGQYDAIIGFEGQTATERERTYWKLHEMAQSNPQYADIIGKHALKMSDLPEKDEILREWEERQQMLQQQTMLDMQGQRQQNRGPIQSAPRPSRGSRREPARVRQ
ncbi:MAG: hypothetical protein HQ580_12370, partial [Planctomycetes bacterium]|nr:hypothetical protein [Planctomycetota bacterium]